ncbi:RNA polymerase sigma-70 factor, ECF subfamily [Pseudarcicella hirudinis]|uniref:RNA polymerase sigma-70 factor, ECF subfamily n=1 Tax=Pseudarcicella hirudinis TaxID=1079859 RepID=A0A1I5Y227_9BACT|nr:RNA polymerase sigma factor [Pseudarcicella hirudinis]SFQ38243.1 RNA polymerase sigma-70 factor, ECF subfamily [Pseudarcicella hirudinis]
MLKEKELVIACKSNDPKAQTAFYNLYKGRLLGVCRRYARTEAEAEDIFQEAFIKIFKNLHSLEKPESVNSWVKSSVIRTAIDHYRKTIQEREQSNYDELLDISVSEEENVFARFNREQILEAINKLPDGYRMVVNLYLIDGYNHGEIAQMLNISEGTSKSQLSRAKEILKQRLIKLGLTLA